MSVRRPFPARLYTVCRIPKLPAPIDGDLSKGILEAINMDSYCVEKRAAVKILLPDHDTEIEPVPTSGGGRPPVPELDQLSNIIKVFNDQFGNIPWIDAYRRWARWR